MAWHEPQNAERTLRGPGADMVDLYGAYAVAIRCDDLRNLCEGGSMSLSGWMVGVIKVTWNFTLALPAKASEACCNVQYEHAASPQQSPCQMRKRLMPAS
eukprot:CAMPEP_0115406176 /NCGR_PEP_ID=MMETSP0271-20121206/18309_1 /TAXON_ID=71861 /ORGANISM="Scrippsiella trochoidea, Strain CCMP3099" /LENGTH=99 /DNA_ID=CAMNT_0002830195 /DNA_START=249 /DNA_END=549 /DNA_ORIENTATION=-